MKPTSEDFDSLRYIAEYAYNMATEKGFWGEHANVTEKLALIHSEVSEALEEWRKQEYNRDKFVEELADIVIRSLDLAEHILPGEIGHAMRDKMERNALRPFRHGKRF